MILIKNFGYLGNSDSANQIFLVLLSIASLILIDTHPEKYLIPALNIILHLVIVYFVSCYEKKSEPERKLKSISRFLRFWYPMFMILICFKEIHWITMSAHDTLYDEHLIGIDRWLFGTDPAVFLSQFINPYAVEFLQIVYSFFYVMPLIYAMELFFSHRYEELKYSLFVIFFAFYLSYIGYLLVPAIGPRFTIFDFHVLNIEMPGIFLTDKIRYLIDLGESIPSNVPNPEAFAQRDAFPSGHTLITILTAFLSYKIKSKSFYFYLPYSILLIFSTIYLRYHYVIDVIAAVPFALITVFVANKLYKGKINFGKNLTKTELSEMEIFSFQIAEDQRL